VKAAIVFQTVSNFAELTPRKHGKSFESVLFSCLDYLSYFSRTSKRAALCGPFVLVKVERAV
jgi:hypothetical protein